MNAVPVGASRPGVQFWDGPPAYIIERRHRRNRPGRWDDAHGHVALLDLVEEFPELGEGV
jgi:hypothetical protein